MTIVSLLLRVFAFLLGVLLAIPADAERIRNLTAVKVSHNDERRVALVIGNSAYKTAPLRNPVNDARAMAKVLSETGFAVTLIEDATQTGMRRAIRVFGDQLLRGGVGLFFFAGHGMQVGGRNFLIPVNADIDREDEVEDQAVDANFILSKMDTARNSLNIMILDACRNNPFARKFRASASGLTQMDAPTGTLIAFATAPGSVASDGDGDNGTYTKHLLASIAVPGLPVEQLFKQVRIGVTQETKDRQIPWESSSLRGDFFFIPLDQAKLAAERQRAEQERIQKAVEEALRRERGKSATAPATAGRPSVEAGEEPGTAAASVPPIEAINANLPATVIAKPKETVTTKPPIVSEKSPEKATPGLSVTNDQAGMVISAVTPSAVAQQAGAPSEVILVDETELVRNVKLPKKIQVEHPLPNVPTACARFVGGWSGRWESTRSAHEVWVERVNPDCSATLIWAFDAVPLVGISEPGYHRRVAQIRDGKLMLIVTESRGTRAIYEIDKDGTLRGRYFRLGHTYPLRLSRLESPRIAASKTNFPSVRPGAPVVNPSQDPADFIDETTLIGELLLPKRLRPVPTSAQVPQNCRSFIGAWGKGRWLSGGPAHELWVLEVSVDCSAKILYAWGPFANDQGGYVRDVATIRGNMLEAQLGSGAKIRYILSNERQLDGTWSRGWITAYGRFTKLSETEIAAR